MMMTTRQKELFLIITYCILLLTAIIFLKAFSFTPIQGLTKISLFFAVLLSLFFNLYLYFVSIKTPFSSAKNLATMISKPFRILVYWLLFPLFTTYLLWTVIGGILPALYTQAFGQTSSQIYHGTVDSTSRKYCTTQFEFKSPQLDHFFFRQCLNPKAHNLKASQKITIHTTVQSSRFGSSIKKIYSVDPQ